MCKIYEIDNLTNSKTHISFCFAHFEDPSESGRFLIIFLTNFWGINMLFGNMTNVLPVVGQLSIYIYLYVQGLRNWRTDKLRDTLIFVSPFLKTLESRRLLIIFLTNFWGINMLLGNIINALSRGLVIFICLFVYIKENFNYYYFFTKKNCPKF